jgi:hypothetical protein
MSSFGFTTPMATPQRGDARLRPGLPAKTIPFDYVFQVALQGTPGNKVQDVVEISSEGVFVALSIGYSLMLDEQRTARTFQPVVDPGIALHNPVFVPRFVPGGTGETFNGFLLTGIPGTEMAVLNLTPTVLNLTPPAPLAMAQTVPPRIEQTVSIEADGTAMVPLTVVNRNIFRVWDKTHNLLSELFEVGTSDMLPTAVIGPNHTNKKVPAAGDPTVHVYGSPGERVEVFLGEHSTGKFFQVVPPGLDVPAPLTLAEMPTFNHRTGRADVALQVKEYGQPPEDVPRIDKLLSVGDVLLVSSIGTTQTNISLPAIPLSMFVVPRPRVASELTLAELAAGLEKSGVDLTRGFRLNPNAANLVAADVSLAQLSDGRLGRIFETGSVAPEEVSFLYSLDMGSTGREYQSKPIHNIAGLGIANGDRPFRPFAKPMVFEPRSSIRLQIEELSAGTAGTLFVVLQGYKILGTGRIPG